MGTIATWAMCFYTVILMVDWCYKGTNVIQLYKSACSNAACSSKGDKINGPKGRPGPACRISGITGCLSDRQGCQAGRQG
jgi:hypothetical protein